MPALPIDGRRLDLYEGAREMFVPLTHETASQLTQLRAATVTPASADLWRVTNVSRVGVIRAGDTEVHLHPKVPLGRLFYLLGCGGDTGRWFQDTVQLDQIDELYPATAHAFATLTTHVLSAGVLHGYLEMRDAEHTIRGRWLVGEQIRSRRGLPLPAEIRFDEFTANIPANRLLRSAARRLLTLGGLPEKVRTQLLGIDRRLGAATLLTRGESLPTVTVDRRSERYRPALALAELILAGRSLDDRPATIAGTGFLFDLALVFERFVEAQVVRAARPYGGRIVAQMESPLDRHGLLRIRPDLIWRRDGRVAAVLDAKYKAEKPAGYPNADAYQMLAYCVRHNLTTGHLVYAAGNESPVVYDINEAGVTIHCHALALDRSPGDIEAQIDRIVSAASTD